jgi:mRNA-degrading endonuclease RelE of RelBE toxin-antitoxin system
MGYHVIFKKSVRKSLPVLPVNVQERFFALVDVLEASGPSGGHIFKNYSKLGENNYHCHLTYHYVACWRHDNNTIFIEVYYVGTRENAPY